MRGHIHDQLSGIPLPQTRVHGTAMHATVCTPFPNASKRKGPERPGAFPSTIPQNMGTRQSKAIPTFHASQTLPTRSGPGLSVILPGRQPDGVASPPPEARTNWKA